MSMIKNMEQLRERVLEIFEQLDDKDPDIQKAGIAAKLSETVISGLKTQIEYSRMIGEQPYIPFLDDCKRSGKLIESPKKLPRLK